MDSVNTQEACFILHGSLPVGDKPQQVNQPHRAVEDPELQSNYEGQGPEVRTIPPFPEVLGLVLQRFRLQTRFTPYQV